MYASRLSVQLSDASLLYTPSRPKLIPIPSDPSHLFAFKHLLDVSGGVLSTKKSAVSRRECLGSVKLTDLGLSRGICTSSAAILTTIT
jgi:hypothetical protein